MEYKLVSTHRTQSTNPRSALKVESWYTWVTPFKTRKEAERALKRLQKQSSGLLTIEIQEEG